MDSEKITEQSGFLPIVARVGKAVLGLFCMHQLASHGDHFNNVEAPLDEQLELSYDWSSQEA